VWGRPPSPVLPPSGCSFWPNKTPKTASIRGHGRGLSCPTPSGPAPMPLGCYFWHQQHQHGNETKRAACQTAFPGSGRVPPAACCLLAVHWEKYPLYNCKQEIVSKKDNLKIFFLEKNAV